MQLPRPPTLATKGGTEVTTRGNRGAIHSIPAGAEHVHSSAGSQPPGQLCHCLVGARLFTAVPLASSCPKQTDAYDLDHTIVAKLVTRKAVSGHGQVQCTEASSYLAIVPLQLQPQLFHLSCGLQGLLSMIAADKFFSVSPIPSELS